jgi:CRP/FNR family transcriptional regulator, cyclic AMP receptor protein
MAAPARDQVEDRVHVFDADPDLLAGIDARDADLLRHHATALQQVVWPGPWTPPPYDPRTTAGFLVIDGLIVRTLRVAGCTCPELLGPGDLLRPWGAPAGSLAGETAFVARQPTRLAVLDAPFTMLAARWPSIMVALLSRSAERSGALAHTLAIVHMRRADERLEACLWHLADRFGRVTPDGVHIPLRLTHELLAQLTCMRRPSASSALGRLYESGRVVRRSDGTWLLVRGADAQPRPRAATSRC